MDCPKGKFGPRNGSIASSECEDCPAGKFSPADGLHSCTSCGKAEYQPEQGQSSCRECQGVGEIGDDTRTECIVDPDYADLQGPTLVERLYSNGLAIILSFSIAVLFMAALFLVHLKSLVSKPKNLSLSTQTKKTISWVW